MLPGTDHHCSTDKAWSPATSEILLALADDCPQLRRVCSVAEKNLWTKVINNEKLEDVQMNVEVWTERERSNKDLLTLLSFVGQEILEVEDVEMGEHV